MKSSHLQTTGLETVICYVAIFSQILTINIGVSGGNTMIMNLWGEKTGPPMSVAHFGFGVGAIIAPQLARNFLSPGISIQLEDVTTIATVVDNGRIEIPYGIVASLAFLLAVFLLVFFVHGPPEGFLERQGSKLSVKAMTKMLAPSSCTRGDTFYGSVVFLLLFLYFIQSAGVEGAMGG